MTNSRGVSRRFSSRLGAGLAHRPRARKLLLLFLFFSPRVRELTTRATIRTGTDTTSNPSEMIVLHFQIEAIGVLGEDGTLTTGVGGVEVAVVYFRAGYAPNDYFGRAEWDARLKLERSTAIKSPSIGYHLAGTKKVQQVLAQEGQVRDETGKLYARSAGRFEDGMFFLSIVVCCIKV